MDVFKKVFDDFRNWNIIDVEFVSFNKKQKKIERPFKLGKLYLVSTHNAKFKRKVPKTGT